MNSKIKTVFVTGGTGFIGKALCKALLASGYNVYVLTRNKKHLSHTSEDKIAYVNTLEALRHIDIDIVINLAGETISKRWTKTARKNIYDSRILTTRRIVDFIRSQQTRPQLLISGSAVGYYGTHPQAVLNENSPLSSHQEGFAHSLCKAWENEAQQAQTLGLRVVLLRIGPVLEKNGGLLSKLLPSFYVGLGSQIGDGKQWLSWIDRDDLIRLILFVIDHDQIHGPVNATAPNPVTNRDFSLELAHVIKRPCFFKMSCLILKTIFGDMADEIMLKGQQVLPKKALDHGFCFSYPTVQKSLQKILKS